MYVGVRTPVSLEASAKFVQMSYDLAILQAVH